VGDWPARWAQRQGSRPALEDEARALDWREFDARIARAAGWLRAAGVGAGDRVAILLRNRTAYLELIFACARLGAISLPVNLRLSPLEIAYLLDDCRPSALFFESALAEVVRKASDFADHTPPLQLPVGGEPDRYERDVQSAAALSGCRAVHPDDPMMLMYTSGTTGHPKGALLPHRKSLYNSLNGVLFFGIRCEDRVLVAAPLFHSLGLQILAIPLLYAGGSLILHSHFDPERVWRAVSEQGVTYLGGVPALHQRLHDTLEAAPEGRYDTTGLRFVFTAGSAVSVELIRAFERHGLVLKQGYGQTETSTLCCLGEADAVRKAGSVGLPVFHVELRVVSQESRPGPPDTWRDVVPGETGEIVARGPITMLGYWDQPEATRETLVDGWLCTGDLATLDDEGFVTLVGRARDMIISGGENVYPAEVEATLREHPAIREIAVVGEPDTRWGEVGRAHVLLEPGAELEVETLLAWASDRLASFKLPRSFVVESELPRTASGKVQKHKLQAPTGA
jgi:fatty-acyl-CoA synthase